MTHTTRIAALLASSMALTLAIPASAQDQDSDDSAGEETAAPQSDPQAIAAARRRGGGHSKMAFMKAYDTNEDGQVSIGEFYTKREAGYARRDADGNGSLTKAEYVGEFEARMKANDVVIAEENRERQIQAANFRFGFMDADENEIMTAAEFHASGARMFKRLDSNEDGYINDKDTAESF